MKKADAIVLVVREWVAKAENDLLTATHTLKLGRLSPTDTICFHAQQCAEKYIKALLVLREFDFPKTHDLEALAARLKSEKNLTLSPDDLAHLKRYATVTRYPGGEVIALSEARHAVVAARRLRKNIRALLPKQATQKVRAPRSG